MEADLALVLPLLRDESCRDLFSLASILLPTFCLRLILFMFQYVVSSRLPSAVQLKVKVHELYLRTHVAGFTKWTDFKILF